MSAEEFERAVARAGAVLRESRAPVIAGLCADVAGIVAAFRLAEKLGAVIDHAGAEWALQDQAVLQDGGLMLISPGEAYERADVFLIVGDRPLQSWPGLSDSVFAEGRRSVALGCRASGRKPQGVVWLNADRSELSGMLAALRARANGRPLARGFGRTAEVDRAVDILKAAAFGVALWSPDEIDALTIEMLTGLIKDLNATTRWSGLSVAPDAGAIAAAMASGWMTGLPLRTSFAHGRPVHDPWQYDARRLVESGDTDVIVWIDAFGGPLPEWLGGAASRRPGARDAHPPDVPSIIVSEATGAAISFPVGRPGRDHDGVVYDRATAALVEIIAQSPSDLPSAAELLTRIAAAASPP